MCFNSDCELHDKCMHYYMGQLIPPSRTSGGAIYPSAWKNGTCSRFSKIEKVEFAWGFNGLFKGLTRYEASEARRALRDYLGRGVSAYYRIHNGEKMLSPERQKEILDFISRYNKTEGLKFDNYVSGYDFS